MAFLRKYIDKPTYIFISSVVAGLSTYLTSVIKDPYLQGLLLSVLMGFVAWLGVETQTDNKAVP